MAIVFALPPKIIDSSYKWFSDLKPLHASAARKIDVMSTQPILHGGLRLDRGKLQVLSADGSLIQDFGHTADSSPVDRPETNIFRDFWTSSDLGHFRLEGQNLHYFDIWMTPVGFRPLGVDRAKTGALVGWNAYPPQLFYFPSDLRNFYRIKWSEESEPVRFFFCDASTAVLAENLNTGLSRFTFFRSGKPVSYTLFDFSNHMRKSDVSAVVATSCVNFYVAGTFGLVRVSY